MMQFLNQLKPLRVVLLGCALLTILLRPAVDMPVAYSGWEIVPSLLMPVLAPLFFMLLMLDTLMASLWRSQTSGDEQLRYKRIQIADLAVAGLLLVSWLPYFIKLVS